MVLSVLGSTANEPALTDILLRETTTLGVRAHPIQHRHEAQREVRSVDTSFGSVAVKIKWVNGEALQATPEYEDCRAIAERAGTPVKRVLDDATVASQKLLMQLREPPGNL